MSALVLLASVRPLLQPALVLLGVRSTEVLRGANANHHAGRDGARASITDLRGRLLLELLDPLETLLNLRDRVPRAVVTGGTGAFSRAAAPPVLSILSWVRATCRVVSVHCAAARHPAPPDKSWTTLG